MSGLYDGWILEHSKAPRGAARLEGATHSARRDNPFCGDRITLDLVVRCERIVAVGFEARACAICIATGSLLTSLAEGLAVDDVARLVESARAAVDASAAEPPAHLEPLALIRSVPTRRRCATLPFEALQGALEDR